MRTNGGPLDIRGQSNVAVVGKRFSGIPGRAIYLHGCINVIVIDCEFNRCGAAVVAVDCTNVTVTRNHYRDIMGNLPSGHLGQFVQLDKVTGGDVSYNRGICDPEVADPEDIVSVYMSSDVRVASNRFMGGGPSGSGSGIMLGDGGGSNLLAEDNVLVNTGQVGIGVAGGSGVTVRRNVIYGAARPKSNVGIYSMAWGGADISDVTITDNRVDWRKGSGAESHVWVDPASAGPVTTSTGNLTGAGAGVSAHSFHLPPP